MTIFDVLNLLGGLCLFLFGMTIMGQGLERRAGSGLKKVLERLTTNKSAGLLTGLLITAIIQSSSATTVMVVGFVNSSLMSLGQAINVIMGANIGTTVTAWILSLGGIEGDALLLQLLKPKNFTPILALVGTAFLMFSKDSKKKDTGTILLGFTTLMFGMETMSKAVSGLADVPAFRELFVAFENPILGMLAGALLTAVIQSSSASVGILQALSATGQVSFGAAIPIIMGQNIGTCITAILSSVGTNKNARRAALVHLSFNVIGTAILLSVFCAVKAIFAPALLGTAADYFGIAVAHSVFNLLCTAILYPMSGLLEKLVCRLVPDGMEDEPVVTLDERLIATPALALARCVDVAGDMAKVSMGALKTALDALSDLNPQLQKEVREAEEKTDQYEDILGTYLVQLSGSRSIGEEDNAGAARLLHLIGDFERISDHGVNLVESAEELREKGIRFTDEAMGEYRVLSAAVSEILDLALTAFIDEDLEAAARVEPLEEVIDRLKEQLRDHHIQRLQQGICTVEAGFVWSDLLTNLERTADHCSNIAGCVIDMAHRNLNLHASLRAAKAAGGTYLEEFRAFEEKYSLPRKA